MVPLMEFINTFLNSISSMFPQPVKPFHLLNWPLPSATLPLDQGSAAAYLVSIEKCSAHPLLAHVWVFGSYFSQLRRFFLLLWQRISVQSRESSGFSTPRANFVFVTLTLIQDKLVMVCVCRPLL